MHILNLYIFYMIFLDIIFNRKIFYEMTFIAVFEFFFIFIMRQMHLTMHCFIGYSQLPTHLELVNFQVDDKRETILIGKRHSNVPKQFKHPTWPSNAPYPSEFICYHSTCSFLFFRFMEFQGNSQMIFLYIFGVLM